MTMRALALAICVVTSALAFGSEHPDSAHATLEKIKQSLLQQAVDNGVRLRGLSYLDDSGRLQESQLFESAISVQGVQIASYLEAAGVTPQPIAEPVDLSDQCLWQSVTGAQPTVGITIDRVRAPNPANDINFEILADFIHAVSGEAFAQHAIASAARVTTSEPSASAFNRYAFGVGSLRPPQSYQLSWTIRFAEGTHPAVRHAGRSISTPSNWVLSSVSDRLPFDGRSRRFQGHALVIEARLTHTVTQRLVSRVSLPYRLPSLPAQHNTALVLKELERGLSDELRRQVANFAAALECTPALYTGQPNHLNVMTMRAGKADGVQLGQWFLAGDPSLMAKHWLNNDNMGSLGIYRAVAVGQRETQLEALTQATQAHHNSVMFLPL